MGRANSADLAMYASTRGSRFPIARSGSRGRLTDPGAECQRPDREQHAGAGEHSDRDQQRASNPENQRCKIPGTRDGAGSCSIDQSPESIAREADGTGDDDELSPPIPPPGRTSDGDSGNGLSDEPPHWRRAGAVREILVQAGVGTEGGKNHHTDNVSQRPLLRQRPSAGIVFRLFTMLDDVAFLEEYVLEDNAPLGSAAQQELEIHPEMLELFALGVPHNRSCVTILLDREALLIPADCFGLLDQRRDHAREGSGLRGELGGGLVVLVKSHRVAPWLIVCDYGRSLFMVRGKAIASRM